MIFATDLRRHRSCSSPGTKRNSASPEKLIPPPPQRKSRPRKLLRLRKAVDPKAKRPLKSRRNTTEPETRPRNDRNTSGDFAGNEVKPQRKVDSASTAQNLLSQIRPSAKPVLRTTGNPADAARKRKRPQIRPNSRRLRQHQASASMRGRGLFIFRHRTSAYNRSPFGKAQSPGTMESAPPTSRSIKGCQTQHPSGQPYTSGTSQTTKNNRG